MALTVELIVSLIHLCFSDILCLVQVYIDMGLATNSQVVVTVITSGASFARSFSIKVSQIECTSLAKGKYTILCLFNLHIIYT